MAYPLARTPQSCSATFFGGADSVTGNNILITSNKTRLLIDCGMYQGNPDLEAQNESPFLYDPKTIDVLVVTHAHNDHIGRIPLLVKEGFKGTIISTPATRDLAEVMLADTAHIVKEHAAREHHPPMYTTEHVDAVFPLWQTLDYHTPKKLGDVSVTLWDAGHILGSAFVEITNDHRDFTLVMTGDLGNSPNPLLRDTDPLPKETTHVITESVYGDRVHEMRDVRRERLLHEIQTTIADQGRLLIPVFSLERTQEILSEIDALYQSGKIPPLPIFLDTPLGSSVTRIFSQYAHLFQDGAQNADYLHRIWYGDHITHTKQVADSKEINTTPVPHIILASSGMSSGGRIMHHLMHVLPEKNNRVCFVGYQGEGTLGRRLYEGAKKVTIYHREVPVRAHITSVSGYSGHKDSDAILAWLAPHKDTIQGVWCVLGDNESRSQLANRIQSELGVPATTPEKNQTIHIGPSTSSAHA